MYSGTCIRVSGDSTSQMQSEVLGNDLKSSFMISIYNGIMAEIIIILTILTGSRLCGVIEVPVQSFLHLTCSYVLSILVNF